MRIGIEAQRIFRRKKHGMDMVALESVKTLQQLDKENEYFIFTNTGEDRDCLNESENVKIISFGGAYPVWEQVLLPREAAKCKLDLMHCTSNTAPVKTAIPLIVTVHDIIYFDKHPLLAGGYTPYQRFGNLYRRFVVRRIFKSAKNIITVSKFEEDHILKLFPALSGKLHVVYNGVGRHFRPVTDPELLSTAREKYHLPDRYLMFLGNTDPKKNSENTIVAFARAVQTGNLDYHLVVGDFDREIVKKYLEKAGLDVLISRIHFPGYINNTDMPALISMADFYLYPSKRESFGIPIIEAMACGTPVITSNTSSMPEVGGDAALYVDPFSPENMVEKILEMAGDEKLRKTLKRKGLAQAEKFSWEESAKKLLNLYTDLKNNL
ncbi:MAG: glycosyltransferase family 1 protein [Sphingobacteriia bacterium]|nr:glycosyltransferase family 1 protein [Sphingobacteriia bacterium]